MSDTSKHMEFDDEPPSSIIDRQGACAFPGLELDIDIVDPLLGDGEQLKGLLSNVVTAGLRQQLVADEAVAEVFIRVVGVEESQRLNNEFRGKDYPTNVLSFPGCDAAEIEQSLVSSASGGPPVMLGDIVIAAPVVEREAREQGKATMDHFCHLVVHGLLHVLGHDHIEDALAEKMEAIEIVILAELGISNPYLLEQVHG